MNSRFRTAPRGILHSIALAWSILASLIAVAAQPALAQLQPAVPSSGLINPRAIVFSPATGKAYAVDTNHGVVQIYNDVDKQMHRVNVGAAPVSIAVNGANGTIYVANAGDGTVSVIDGHSDAVVATVPVGSHPYSIAADQTTGKVFVTHTFGDQLSILDGATNKVTDLNIGSSDLIAINSRTGMVYLLGYGSAVKVLDEATQKLSVRPVGKHAWGLMLNQATGTVYVARIENADLAALKADSSEPEILLAGAIPCAVAVDSKGNRLYVANFGDNSVTVIDARTGHARATVRVGDHPKSIAFDPNRNLVYVANTGGGSVTVIDAASNAVLATLPAGKNPYALAVAPGSSSLYVANEADDQPSTVVDLSRVPKPLR